MAKSKSKIRRYSRLIHTILSGIYLITAIVLLIMVISEEVTLDKNEAQVNSLKETIALKENTLAETENKIEELNHIDESIEAIKKTYFANALTIETKARNEEGDYKVAFLTFDDGPFVKTSEYLDVLKNYGIQGTFFLNKKTNSRYDEIYTRYKSECHTIGNHTASHEYKAIYSSVDAFGEELVENRQFIEEKLGYTTEVMRFPGGSYELTMFKLNRESMMAKLNELHYGYVDWNSLTGDGEGGVQTADYYYHRVIDNVNGQRVLCILMHDYSENTLEALPKIIEELQNQGYIFLPLYYDSPTVKKQ